MLLPPNTTCDVYRAGNTPPAAPDVPGVACYLKANYPMGLERNEGDQADIHYTHALIVETNTDIRDDYNLGVIGPNADTLYIPDKTGTPWKVIFTEFVDLDSVWQHKRVFLSRQAATWPTTNL